MKTFSVVARLDANSKSIKDELIKLLENDYQYDDEAPDFCFTVGGDGTFLYAIHQYLTMLDKVKFIGLHTGTLGFFSDYKEKDLLECIEDFKNKEVNIQTYNLLKCTTDLNMSFYAVNEIRLETLSRAQLINIDVNDEYFETFRGNGILVCSQIGSTAYNRSIGGAIIDHNVSCIEMVEIAGINHQKYPTCNSPIIFDAKTKLKFTNKYFEGISLLYDQFEYTLKDEKSVEIELCDTQVQVLRFKKTPYLTRIKSLF